MAAVRVYKLEQRFTAPDVARRGHHVVYRAEETNRCPGCGRSHWHVGRLTAECAFCGAAVALAGADWGGRGGAAAVASATAAGMAETASRSEAADADGDRRGNERVPVTDRTLQLLIDGSPKSFAIHNLSSGGLMGDNPSDLVPGTKVEVRFEGGILVPATVRWSADGLIGLAFETPVLFDTNRPH